MLPVRNNPYHPAAEPWRGRRRDLCQPPQGPAKVQVPRVTVNLVQALRLPSRKWVVVPVQENREVRDQCGILILDALFKPDPCPCKWQHDFRAD